MNVLARLFQKARRQRVPLGHVDFHRRYSSKESAIGVDLAGHIVGVTAEIERLTGWPESEFLGNQLYEFVRMVEAGSRETAILAVARSRPQHVHVVITPLKNTEGTALGYVLIIQRP